MDFIFYIFLGAAVGFAVGLTGVGGGSLMTPLLVFSGVPIKVAIGTDLLYAAITKSGGAITHGRLGNINWQLVFLLAAGSIPGAILTAFLLSDVFNDTSTYVLIFNRALGLMLVLTSLSLLFKNKQERKEIVELNAEKTNSIQVPIVTILIGLVLGVLVTLSSVGAGAFCAALLFLLYPKLPVLQVIGTDIAHAVPLTLIAGFAHLFVLQSIDWNLLLGLIIGSLPAVQLGAKMAMKISSHILQPILGGLLLIIGLKFIFF